MSKNQKPHKLPVLFNRSSDFHEQPKIGSDDIKKLGVDIHPLARTFTDLSEEKVAILRENLRPIFAAGSESSLPPWLFVGDQLLDDPCRWRACQELKQDPRQGIQNKVIEERDALRFYLEQRISAEGTPASRAAAALIIALNYAPNFAYLRALLKSPATPRPNVAKLLANYCDVERRTMSYAIATGYNDSGQLMEVYRENRRTFHEAQVGHVPSVPRGFHQIEFRHRLRGANAVAGRKRNKIIPDLALFAPDISAEDYIHLQSDGTIAVLDELQSKLGNMRPVLSEKGFLCLILPPQLVLGQAFRALQAWMTNNGYVTRATACATYKAGLERMDVTPRWGFVWVLSKNKKQHLYAPFKDALVPPVKVPPDQQLDYILKRILYSFCPPDGSIFFNSSSLAFLKSMVSVVSANRTNLIVPDHLLDWMLQHWKATRKKR